MDFENLSGSGRAEPSAEIKKRVEAAREIQRKRFAGTAIACNAKMDAASTRKFCVLSDSALLILKTAFERLSLSARAYDKILRIARTIADLDGAEIIENSHIAEAIQYRSFDRSLE